MVEDIEGLELKLRLHALCNVEVLEEGRVCEVIRRSAQSVASNIADCAEGRADKGPRGCSIRRERGDRSEDCLAMGYRVVLRRSVHEAICAARSRDIWAAIA